MNTLLIFFALPVATVILAVVLQKILRNPILVASTFFAIYLIVTFAFFDASFLVFAIVYTILAYITAVLIRWICHLIKMLENHNNGNYRIIERPITINNTRPSDSVNLTSDATLLTNETNTCTSTDTLGRTNENCNCGCNCRRK